MLAYRYIEESPDAFTNRSSIVENNAPVELRAFQPSCAALTETFPAWMDTILERLGNISSLRQDWDSYGAPMISRSRILQAFDVVQSVMHDRAPPPDLIPTSDGSIQIEWHVHGIDLEIVLVSDADLDLSFDDLRGEIPSYEGTLNIDIVPLVNYVRALAERGLGSGDG